MRNQKVRTLFRKGLNLRDDPTAIDNEEAVLLQNVIPDKFGVLNTRPSMTYMETVLGALGEVAGGGYRPFLSYLRPIDFIYSTVPGCEIVMVCRLVAGAQGGGRASITGSTAALTLGYYVLAIAQGGLSFTATFYGHIVAPAGSFPELTSRPFLKNSGETTWVLFKDATYVVHNVDAARLPCDNTGPLNNGIRIDKARLGGTAEFAVSSFYPRYMTEWDKGGRVLFANLGAGKYGSSVLISDGEQGATTNAWFVGNNAMADNGYWLLIGDANEGEITGVHNVANSPENYVQQKSILVFKRNYLYRILGEVGLTTASADTRYANMEPVKSSLNAGCVSQNTIQDTPYGTLWAGPDDVWFLPFGNQPIRVGTKLRPALASQSALAQERWFATYHDGLYHLHVARDGQSLTDEAEQCEAEYTLDMRRGPPSNAEEAVWYGPQLHKASNCTAGVCRTRVDTRGGKTARLTGMTYGSIPGTNPREFVTLCDMQGDDTYDTGLPGPDRDWFPSTAYDEGDRISPADPNYIDPYFLMTFECVQAGTTSSTRPNFTTAGNITDNTVVWRRVGSDTTRGLTWKPDVCNVESTLAQANNAIIPKVISKEWGEETAELEKLITGAYVTYFASNSFQATYNFLTDTESNERILSSSDGTLLDYDTIDGTLALERRWQARFLAPDPSKRSRARSFQLTFAPEEGIILPDGLFLTMLSRPWAGGTPTVYRGPVSGGYYYNLGYVETAVLAAIGYVGDIVSRIGMMFTGRGGLYFPDNSGAAVEFVIPTASSAYVTAAQAAANVYILGLFGVTPVSGTELTSKVGFYPATDPRRNNINVRMHIKDFTMRFRTFKRNPV